jgi:hypothetical protein
MEYVEMASLTRVFDQFVERFGRPATHEQHETWHGTVDLASWVLPDASMLFLDEGDSSSNRLGQYRTAHVRIVSPGESIENVERVRS